MRLDRVQHMKLADVVVVELHRGRRRKAAGGAPHSPIRQMVP